MSSLIEHLTGIDATLGMQRNIKYKKDMAPDYTPSFYNSSLDTKIDYSQVNGLISQRIDFFESRTKQRENKLSQEINTLKQANLELTEIVKDLVDELERVQTLLTLVNENEDEVEENINLKEAKEQQRKRIANLIQMR